jgi:hypothetical protein
MLTLGVLRRDATIVPFATYDGKRWENHWPDPAVSVDVPISLRSVPSRWWGRAGPRETWQVSTDSAAGQTVHVRQPDWLQTHCQKQVGLRTDYQPRQRPPGPEAQPYPKDGLAVSPSYPLQLVELVSEASSERQRVMDVLPAAFRAREDDAVTQAQDDGAAINPSSKDLEALPITIEALYAFGTRPRVYWVEAHREYKKGAECAAIIFGSGWLMFDAGRLTYLGFDVSVVPCSREGLHYMLPLGVVSLPRGSFWIAQMSGWDDEAYDVLEIGAQSIDVVLSTRGGGC